MATIKLNKGMRDKIVNEIIGDKFTKQLEELVPAWQAFAEAARVEMLGEEVAKQLDALPDGWVPDDHNICVTMEGGRYMYVEFNGVCDKLQRRGSEVENTYRRFTFRGRHSTHKLQSDSLKDEFVRLQDEEERIVEVAEKTRRDVKAVVNSATTVNRLCEIWPEIKDVVMGVVGADTTGSTTLPAKRLSELNAMLELPPEKETN